MEFIIHFKKDKDLHFMEDKKSIILKEISTLYLQKIKKPFKIWFLDKENIA